jgi:hypothetical protein
MTQQPSFGCRDRASAAGHSCPNHGIRLAARRGRVCIRTGIAGSILTQVEAPTPSFVARSSRNRSRSSSSSRPLCRLEHARQGAADAAPSWFNRFVPPKGPPNADLLRRRYVTLRKFRVARSKDAEPAPDEFPPPMVPYLSECTVGDPSRAPLPSHTTTCIFDAKDSWVDST